MVPFTNGGVRINETKPFLALIVNLFATSPPIDQIMSPSLEETIKVGVGLVNTIFSKTLPLKTWELQLRMYLNLYQKQSLLMGWIT
jgi:hypothetical protein